MDKDTARDALPPDLAEKLEARRRAMISDLRELSEKNGKLLFELQWMTPEEIRKAYRHLRLRSWETVIELLLLFAAILIGTKVFASIAANVFGL